MFDQRLSHYLTSSSRWTVVNGNLSLSLFCANNGSLPPTNSHKISYRFGGVRQDLGREVQSPSACPPTRFLRWGSRRDRRIVLGDTAVGRDSPDHHCGLQTAFGKSQVRDDFGIVGGCDRQWNEGAGDSPPDHLLSDDVRSPWRPRSHPHTAPQPHSLQTNKECTVISRAFVVFTFPSPHGEEQIQFPSCLKQEKTKRLICGRWDE